MAELRTSAAWEQVLQRFAAEGVLPKGQLTAWVEKADRAIHLEALKNDRFYYEYLRHPETETEDASHWLDYLNLRGMARWLAEHRAYFQEPEQPWVAQGQPFRVMLKDFASGKVLEETFLLGDMQTCRDFVLYQYGARVWATEQPCDDGGLVYRSPYIHTQAVYVNEITFTANSKPTTAAAPAPTTHDSLYLVRWSVDEAVFEGRPFAYLDDARIWAKRQLGKDYEQVGIWRCEKLEWRD